MASAFEECLDRGKLRELNSLESPARVQAFLDSTAYSADLFDRSPVRVFLDRRANCFDGAVFAAAVFSRLGYPPLLVDLFPEPGTDDDHVLAIFQRSGHLGAVAKSNFVGLRYREPIYRNLRELVLSYFEDYFNVDGQKTLRTYTAPLNLQRFDRFDWICSDEGLGPILETLGRMHRYPLLTPEMIEGLSLVDTRSYEAGLSGSVPEGLYQPGNDNH